MQLLLSVIGFYISILHKQTPKKRGKRRRCLWNVVQGLIAPPQLSVAIYLTGWGVRTVQEAWLRCMVWHSLRWFPRWQRQGRGGSGGMGSDCMWSGANPIRGVFLVWQWREWRPVRHGGRETEIAPQRFVVGIPLPLWVSMQSAETALAPVFHLM